MRLLLVSKDRRVGAGVAQLVAGADVDLEQATRVSAAMERLVLDGVSCVLLHLGTPDDRQFDLLDRVLRLALHTPVVVLVDGDDAAFAAHAIGAGAQDVLVLGELDAATLLRTARHAVERQRIQVRLTHQALHDPLTGLPNRILFLDRLRQSLSRLARTQTCLAVMFFDLDEFKLVNDRDGHDAGDALLLGVAHALGRTLRGGDTAARMGGDEFVVLCEDVAGVTEARRIGGRLLRRLPGPASMGIAVARTGEEDPKVVVADADAAMYRAKRAGGASYAMADGSAPIGV